MLLRASLVVLIADAAYADEATPTTTTEIAYGVDGALVIPVGDYGDAVSFAIGPLGRIELAAGPGYATIRAGLLYNHSKLDGAFVMMFPVYGGYRYPLGRSNELYLAAELGLDFIYSRFESSLGTGSNTDFEVGFTVGGGRRWGALDVRAGLFSPDVDNIGLMASIGYDL